MVHLLPHCVAYIEDFGMDIWILRMRYFRCNLKQFLCRHKCYRDMLALSTLLNLKLDYGVIFTKNGIKIAMFILIDMASTRRITWNLMLAMVSDVQCCPGPLEKELRIKHYGPDSLSPLLFYVQSGAPVG